MKLKLIFTASNEEGDIRRIAARHLLAISKNRPELTKKVLDDWYLAEKKDYASFAIRYPMNGEVAEKQVEIDRMKACCDEAEIIRRGEHQRFM